MSVVQFQYTLSWVLKLSYTTLPSAQSSLYLIVKLWMKKAWDGGENHSFERSTVQSWWDLYSQIYHRYS